MLTNIPWLSIITYVPLAGALALVFLFPKDRPGPIKYFATFVAGLDFVISLPLWPGMTVSDVGRVVDAILSPTMYRPQEVTR